jgi:hypothetical protein
LKGLNFDGFAGAGEPDSSQESVISLIGNPISRFGCGLSRRSLPPWNGLREKNLSSCGLL